MIQRLIINAQEVTAIGNDLDPTLPFLFHCNLGSETISFECVDSLGAETHIGIGRDNIAFVSCRLLESGKGLICWRNIKKGNC